MFDYNRGVFLSKTYDKVNHSIGISLKNRKGQLTNKDITIKNGIIEMDNDFSHIRTYESYMEYLFPDKKKEWDIFIKDYKPYFRHGVSESTNLNGFQMPEILYASFFASQSEVSIIYCEYDQNALIENSTADIISSYMIFLPKQLNHLTDMQRNYLINATNTIKGANIMAIAQCDEDYQNNIYHTREESIGLLNSLSTNIITKKGI